MSKRRDIDFLKDIMEDKIKKLIAKEFRI